MKIHIVSGTKMLTMCNRADRVREIEKDNEFTLVEHAGQRLFFEGNIHFHDNHVFIVNKNADFTEGRGPMHFHAVYRELDEAMDYIMQQYGIMGTEQRVSNHAGVNIHGVPYCVSKFNGYEIVVAELK